MCRCQVESLVRGGARRHILSLVSDLLPLYCFRANPSHQPAGMIRCWPNQDTGYGALLLLSNLGLSCPRGSARAVRSG